MHSVQQCQEDDVISQTCNLFALADSFFCRVVHLCFKQKGSNTCDLHSSHKGQYQGSCISLVFLRLRQFSKAMKGDIPQQTQPSVMQTMKKVPRCRGAEAGGSQQTRLNPWDQISIGRNTT